MAEECIHGLDSGLCDICFPKPKPLEDAATAAPTRRATGVAARRAGAPKRSTTVTPRKPLEDVSAQRIYHVTHVSNLPQILETGALLADALLGDARVSVDISSPETREARRAIEVAGGETVAGYVPFFLSPNGSLWESIRAGAADPRLSPDIRHTEPADFVILVSTVKDAGEDAVSTDGDASHVLTRFGTTQEDAERMLRRLRADEDSLVGAEYLVKGSFSLENLTLIGVAHDKARDVVRPILGASAFAPKLAVYPPWFAKPEV